MVLIYLASPTTLDQDYITLDLETRLIDGKHIPYLISWYKNTKDKGTFYITNYDNNPDLMIKECILSLCRWKFHLNKIYIHNLANFDGIFLLKNIIDLASSTEGNYTDKYPNIIINNDRIITIDFYYKKEDWKKPIVLSFRDSLQILPASLRKLAKYFNVGIENEKSIFPYDFVNIPNLDLLYCGNVPAYKYFDGISIEEYLEYCDNFKDKQWSLQIEASKYCMQDCIALHHVITKFNQFYFNEFELNINEAPTISSHAFKLFRTKYLEKEIIPMIYGDEHTFIKSGYTGGATDMYIPSNDYINNELVYGYDVNSLYPYVMKNEYMPVGNKTYFEGDIRKSQPNAFGFFYCEVEAPINLMHPIIQLHVNTKGGIRTMAPTGTFKTVVFSPEMDNAIKLGYKFKILKGYTYDKKIIFKDYIQTLYHIRLQYSKEHPMNYIAKILMNSLYGRFGMKDIFDTILILNEEKFLEFSNNINIKSYYINDTIKLDSNYLVKFENKIKQYYPKIDYNINVAIAAAITGYARIYMSQFKNNNNLKLFYSDTDSIYTNLNPEEMNQLYKFQIDGVDIINSKVLGKLKLESVSKKAVFISPKCYGLLSQDNNFKYKVKGLINKTSVNINDFENLLIKDSMIKKNQTKWYKSLSEGTISLLEQSYTLQQSDNKRELIYNTNNKLINTKPYFLINNQMNK